MKAGWETKKLGEVAEVIAGQSPEGSFYNTLGNGLPFYQGKKGFGTRFVGSPTTWTTQVTKIALEGDVLMSVRAPVGPVNFATQKSCIGRGLAAIRSRSTLDKNFLFYFLLSQQDEISGTEGAVFASINKNDIQQISVAVPSLSEQHRLVALLDETFDSIATAKAHAEKNLQNTRAVFDSHLEAVFRARWETCELVTLAEAATDISDGDHLPPPKSSTGVPFITISNIDKDTHKVDFSDTFMVPLEYFQKLKPNKRPRRGDLLYTVTGSFGIPVIVEDDHDFCFQRHIGLIRPNPETDSKWLYYLLLSPQVFRQAEDGATGTAQKTVSLKVLRSLEVPRVSLPQQRADASALEQLSIETQRLEALYRQKLTALEELKKALLHQAFAGEL